MKLRQEDNVTHFMVCSLTWLDTVGLLVEKCWLAEWKALALIHSGNEGKYTDSWLTF